MFLSNWLVFKIVLAAVTGLVDYPLAADVLLVYDNANKLYLSGGSLEYVSNVVLYKGETSYEISESLNLDISNEQILYASDAEAGDEFGNSCDVHGDYAVVAASKEHANGVSDAGSVYVYHRSGNTWIQQAKLIASDGEASDYLGGIRNLAIYGDTVVVGARDEDTGGSAAGSAYVFVRSGTTWSQQAILRLSNPAASDQFATGVAIYEDTIVIGAPTQDTTASDAGSLYVFTRSGTTWTQRAQLQADNAGASDRLGDCVSIYGDTIVAGAYQEDTTASDAGSVYVFTGSGSNWSQQAQIQANDAAATDYFGFSCAISGDTIVVGSRYDDDNGTNSGSAYVFTRSGNTWTQQAKLTASDAAASDDFGWAVDIDGDHIVVAAYGEDTGATDAGAIYVFSRSGSTWTENKKIQASSVGASDYFGYGGVRIDNGTIITVAPNEDQAGADAGAAYIYSSQLVTNYYITQPGTYRADLQICGIDYKTNEVEVTSLNPGNAEYPNDLSETSEIDHGTSASTLKACSVSLDGTRVAIGADDGRVKVYHLESGTWTLKKEYTKTGQFGTQVILNDAGTRLFVSDPADNSNIGKVYVYDYSGTAWGASETHSWTSPDGSTSDYFGGFAGKGIDCNSDGTRLLVVTGYTGIKKAWIFDHNGTSWNTAPTKTWSSGSAWWGTTCALNDTGDRAFIGYQNGVDIFHYDGSNWPTSATKNYTGSGNFGASLTINGAGTRLLVGAYDYSTGNGQTTLYDYTESSWNASATQTINGSNGTNTYYGHGINMSRDGKRYLVSTHGSSTYFSSGGFVELMEDTTGSGSFTLKQTFEPEQASEYMGSYQFHEGLCLDQKGYIAVILSTGTDVSRIYSSIPIPNLTFDNYNKFSLTNTPTYASSKFAYYSNVYDIGTLTSDINIDKTGDYTSVTFDTSSNVAYFSNATVGTVLDAPATRAFFYGNFDDTFSDGDVTTAASKGRFYADMPETTTEFGTVSVTSSTSTSTTYQLVVPNELTGTNVLIVGGGGGGGPDQSSVYWPSAGGGGKVQNLTNQTISAGTYTIVVGNGGNGRFESPSSTAGTTSSAFGTSAVGGGAGSVGTSGTSGSGNGPGSNSGYNVGGGGGDASVGSNAGSKGGSGGDGSNVSWLDGSIYGEQVVGQAYFGGGGFGGDSGGPTAGKGNGVPGTGGGGSYGQVGQSGMIAIYSSVGLGIKYLDFDTYNKLSIQNITPTATTLTDPSGNTHSLGTATSVYIKDTGTYEAVINASDKFALVSNTTGNLGTYLTLHDNVAISHTTGGGDTTVTVNNIKGNTTYKIYFNRQWSDTNAAYETRFGLKIKDSSDVYIRQINSFSEYSGNSLMLYDGGGSFDNTVLTASSQFTVSGDRVYLNGSSPFILASSFYVVLTMSTSDVITGKFFIGDTEVVTYFLTNRQSNTGTIGETGNKFEIVFPSSALITDVNLTVEEYNPEPQLNHDGYNKLSIENITPTATTLTDPSGNIHSLGTISDIYIEDKGTYAIETKDVNTFAFANTVVNGFSTASPNSQLYYPLTSEPSANVWSSTTDVSYGSDGVTFNSTSSIFGIEFTVPTSGVFTVSCNFMKTSFADGTGVIIASSTNQNSPELESNFTATSHAWRSTNTGYRNVTGLTHYTNRWYHMVWVHDKTNGLAAYIDGIRVYSYGGTITSPQTSFIVGPNYRSGTQRFGAGGKMSDIRIYNTAISPTEAELIYKADNKYIPSLDFDNYNKLSISGITPTSTSLRLGSNTYDIGTATDIYIEDTGTYEIETKDANTFALASNVVSGSITYPPSSTVNAGNFTLAFRHGTGTTDTSSNNCTLYSGMTTGDYDWGTVNSVTSTSTETTYNVTFSQMNNVNYLVLAGGGGGGNDYPEGGGGGGGMLDGTETSIPGNTYDIVVGNGGGRRVNGTNSSFYTFDAVGGGCGRSGVGADGGSGGGGRDSSAGGSGVAGPPRQGYNGGTGYIIDYGSGGGGGGAGGNGGNAGNHVGGTGGTGRVWSFNNTRYGGGGGGGTRNSTGGSGGAGGGGTGGQRTADGSNGTNHLGGGGGCKASGGSGTVILNFDATQSSISPRYFDFDTYNKLVISNVTPTSTTLKYDSNTYDIGTATNIYVEDTGTYEIEVKTSNAFIFASNVVSGTLKTIEPAFSGGYYGAHALTYDGKLYAWGQNTAGTGELGVGDANNRSVPTLCTGITQGQVAKFLDFDGLTHRSYMTWVKTTDNKIYATGNASLNQIPGHTTDLNTFTDVTSHFGDQSLSANNIIQVSTGSYACAGLTESGNVWTWGRNDNARGNLGNGGTTSSTQAVPAQITFNGATDNIIKLANGHDFTIALDNESNVWLWGTEWLGSTWSSASPIKMGTALDTITITDISASYSSMYAISNTGVLYASGDAGNGQIMDGTQTDVTSSSNPDWKEVTYFSSNNITVNKVYPGTQYAGGGFVDTSDGWYAFGANGAGNLGLGDTSAKLSPVKFTGVSNIKKLAVGYDATYAMTEDGKYYAWGGGTSNARGDNTTGNIPYPKYIDTLPNILAPSFEFDGYDKVLAHMKPQAFVYEFYCSALLSSTGYMAEYTEISSSTLTLNTNMFTIADTNLIVSGVQDDLFDGDTSETGGAYKLKSVDQGGLALGIKLFTLTTPIQLTQLSISTHRPKYYPGLKIVLNGITILNETSSGSNSDTPSPYTKSYTFTPLSFSPITKYTKDTHTYDANQAQIITVSDPGTYNAQLSQSDVFALASANVSNTSTTGLYTWAFHHGNFDNAYGDGDILTARDNGRFYTDTPAYTGDIGTITVVNPLVSSNVSFRLNEYTQNDSSDTNTTGIMLTEIDVFDDTNTAMTYGTDYRADLYRAAYADNAGDGGSGSLSDDTTPYNDDGSRLNDDVLVGSGGYIGWVNGTYNASATGINRKYPYAVDDELIRLVPLTGKIIGKVQFAYKGTGTTPGWKVYRGTTLVETTNYAGTDINTQGNQTTHQIVDTVSSTTYTFEPPSGGLTANVLMVAGGAGGGARAEGGGGGAGGLVYRAGTSLANGSTKTIVVGNGDSGGQGIGEIGFNGKDTTFTGLDDAIGGGGGGSQHTDPNTGGSGGGGNGGDTVTYGANTGASGTAGQGNAGGDGNEPGLEGGGGGGAGGVGANASSGNAGDGGIGKFFGTGSSFTNFGDEYGDGGWFAGGGGGGNRNEVEIIPGGRGGGGYGQSYNGYMGPGGSQHGMVHTGGGGGGGGAVNRDRHPGYDSTGVGGVKGHAGRGGSGIVLVQTNVAPPNGANTATVQVGNPRRRSLPPSVAGTGSEVNRFYIIDSASTPTYRLPTHWYTDPVGSNSNNVPTTQGSHSLQKRADGGISNVWYQTSYNYFAEYGNNMAQTADAVFMPVGQQSYDVLLSIGSNGDDDISFEMNADGTASLRRSVYTTSQVEIAGGSIVCFEAGKWHHITLTVDSGGNAVGYVNGYPVVSGTYTSVAAVGSRSGNMHFRCGVSDVTFRKFLTYEVNTYNFHMSPKQVMQRAAEVGLGPKLEYDGLNTINVVNTEPGSGTEITIYESNVNDTSNLYVVSCNESSYLLSNAGTYYAQIKGTDTFTITRPLTITDDHFPLYQYPPVVTGTKSSLTTSLSADTWNTWTMSGASTGNGQYQVKTSHATNAPGGTHATAAGLFTNGVKIEIISDGGASIYSFLHTSQLTNFDITLQLPSAKTIRKYVLYPADTNAPVSTPGGSVDPTLPGNGSEENTRRPKSWVLKGSNDDTSWTTIHTVTNQPPSIYGDVHSISSPASYQYYQLSISANNGSSQFLILGELQLWGDA